MRRLLFASLLLVAVVFSVWAVPTGAGASTPAIAQSFVTAFSRGGFSQLVQAATANVRSFSTGLVQEFPSIAGNTLGALVKPVPTAPVSVSPPDTLQVYPDIYSFYANSVGGVVVAGFPTSDTIPYSSGSTTCDYQIFTLNYAIFACTSPAIGTFYMSDPIFTEWVNNGGIGGALGPLAGSASSVTSRLSTVGTQQLFRGGAIYAYPAGSATSPAYTVSGGAYSGFTGAGGVYTLGFPTSEDTVLSSGLHRQTFENGRIEYTVANSPTVIFPIHQINIVNNSNGLTLAVGATATLSTIIFDGLGNQVSGRALSWSSSNGSAVSVQGNGDTAVITARAAGSANIIVTGEGITSNTFPVHVIGQCCNIGDGAPTSAITQAFQNAATRNRLSVKLPNPSPVARTGAGYVQVLTSSASPATTYAIAESDNAATAYVIGGPLYAAYLTNGGFAGPLGFPASDASAGGTQLFTSGAALAASPVLLVPVPLAPKWVAAGAELGPLGGPAGGASAFVSIGGISGAAQPFGGGFIYGINAGSRAGQAFISSGLILARYQALSGPGGSLGLPVSDIVSTGGILRQNFETGYIDLQPGASAAAEHFNPRNPAITALPATVAPGGKVHITVSGFAFGASLTVGVGGQSNFTALAPGGEFSWDIVVPAAAKAGAITIQATASGGSDKASGAYTVSPVAQLRPGLRVASGDQQSGTPGSLLAAPLIAVLADINGNPLAGVPVTYTPAPLAAVTGSSVTDSNGVITAQLRLPPIAGVTGLTVSAAGQIASFSALSASKTITGFPAFTQLTSQGGFVAAFAAIMRFAQNSNSLGAPNGIVSPAALTQYLTANNGFVLSETGSSIANPWVAIEFAGVAGGVISETPAINRVYDLLSAGYPLLIELTVKVDGLAAGGVAVNAIGVNSDGTIAIADPNPGFARAVLDDYLNGFQAQGHSIQGAISGVLRLDVTRSSPAGFVVSSQLSASGAADSPSGSCSNAIDVGDAAIAGQAAASKTGAVRFLQCDGTQPVYQLGWGTNSGAAVLDLANGKTQSIAAGSALAYAVSRQAGVLVIAPQALSVSAVVNTASFAPGVSPGGIFTIFGTGFTAGPAGSSVSLGGQPSSVLAALPFQINARLASGVVPGTATLQVTGPLGSVNQDITIASVAPGIFVIGSAADGQPVGAIVNQDGTINSSTNPAQRGQFISVYCTGLGATVAQGSLQTSAVRPTVTIGGVALTPSFAGLTPGIPGLYQVNVQIPPTLPPGAETVLTLQQGGQTSNAVIVAVQ